MDDFLFLFRTSYNSKWWFTWNVIVAITKAASTQAPSIHIIFCSHFISSRHSLTISFKFVSWKSTILIHLLLSFWIFINFELFITAKPMCSPRYSNWFWSQSNTEWRPVRDQVILIGKKASHICWLQTSKQTKPHAALLLIHLKFIGESKTDVNETEIWTWLSFAFQVFCKEK